MKRLWRSVKEAIFGKSLGGGALAALWIYIFTIFYLVGVGVGMQTANVAPTHHRYGYGCVELVREFADGRRWDFDDLARE
jgi:hypothetical protein